MEAFNLHLALNYYPMTGSIIGTIILVIGMWKNSDKANRVSLWIFLAVALITFPAYITGEIAGSRGVSTSGSYTELVNQHRGSALIAFALIEATGIAAVLALIFQYRKSYQPRWIVVIVLALSFASAVAMTRTTLAGRQIKSGVATIDSKANSGFQRKIQPTQKREKIQWHV